MKDFYDRQKLRLAKCGYKNDVLTKKKKEVKINLAKNAKSLGAHVFQCENYNDLKNALKKAKNINKTTVIYTQCDRFHEVEGYSWWDVPVAETSKMNSVNKAYKIYLKQKKDQRFYN